MKKFLLHISIVLLPLLCIPVFNYTVDPGHVYGNYEQGIAALLQHHRYVKNINPNFEHRRLKKALIESCDRDIDMLILGTSSAIYISEDMFDHKKILNLGVSAGTFKDISALLYHYIQMHGAPKEVIISVDPHHFNGANDDARWKNLSKEVDAFYHDVLSEDIAITFDYEKWTNLLSPSYFKESVIVFLWQKRMEYMYGWDFAFQTTEGDITAADTEQSVVVCNDGSIIPWRDPNLRPGEERKRITYVKPIWQWDFHELSSKEIDHWCKLIEYIQQQGIKLYFFETCYHPVLYKSLATEKRYDGARQAMMFIPELAKEYGIEIIGTYDPARYDFSDPDFLDALHMCRSSYRKILRDAQIE